METKNPEPLNGVDLSGIKVGPSNAGHGDGLFALRSFQPGERIVSDDAISLVVLPSQVDASSFCTLQDLHDAIIATGKVTQLLQGGTGGPLFRGLPTNTMVRNYQSWAEEALCTTVALERARAVDAMLVFSYNAYTTTLNGHRCQAVYPVISKANHSCTPNGSVYAYNNGHGEIYCIRPIACGDEVIVSYLTDWQLALPVTQRQQRFLQNWEFNCFCRRCTAASDDARKFSCPVTGCNGCCTLRQGDNDLEPFSVSPCALCGHSPTPDVVAEWQTHEQEIESLINRLPDDLYCAWAPSEDFSALHPNHWLTWRWKIHLASHTEYDAEQAETTEEAEQLRAEAASHFACARRCAETTIGFAIQNASCEPPGGRPSVQGAKLPSS